MRRRVVLRSTALLAASVVAITACSDADPAPVDATTPVDAPAADDEPAADALEPAAEPAADEPADTGSDAATEAATAADSSVDGDETSDSAESDNASTPATDDGTVTEEDLARFIAATESAIAGTSVEGIVLEAPEIYIAIAQGACARFSAGDDFTTIAAELLADLATDEPASDDERLVGAILGAATHTICPEHADKI